MKNSGEIKRKRLIIYYILAIVLPCLILGILAFRGIKNDQALVEREQRRNLLEAGQQIIQETDAYLSSIENSFAEIIDSITIPGKAIFTDSLLNRFSAQHQDVAGIFFISDSGVPGLLNNGMLYVPDDLLTVSDVAGFQATQNIWEKGWQFEFRENDYTKALEYYQSVLPNATGEQSGGEILNAIARVQKRLKLDGEAIETYNLIWNNYPQVLIQNKIPLGAVALLEKSLLYLKTDTVSALKNVHFLLRQIQKPMWEMEYSHYANFLSKIDEIISRCENSSNEETGRLLQRIYTMKDSLLLSEKHTEYLLAFLGNSEIVLGNMETDQENHNHRHKTRINGKTYLYSLLPGNEDGQWGLIMDPDNILKNTIQHLILEKANALNFNWEVTGENGELLLGLEYILKDAQPVYTLFPSHLPTLSLTLYPEDSGLLVSLFSFREGLFFYIFILIIIILAFGLLFTLQTINHELQFSKMKSYFMSTVSHEFKSPLTSIRQMAEMLVRGRVPSPERQQKYYTTILKQSERLSHLIENILDFSKMEDNQKHFHFEKDNIVNLVKNAVTSFENNMADQGFHISLSEGKSIPDVIFDKEAMEQVMHNLIDNACKYSGESRIIKVATEVKSRNVMIKVTDYGVGIRKEDKDKIFDRFYRAGDELTQTVRGSGIGLTIVKQIVEAHHGEIVIESSPGKGSTFSIILPVE